MKSDTFKDPMFVLPVRTKRRKSKTQAERHNPNSHIGTICDCVIWCIGAAEHKI
jgi:hypothetical protein